MASTSANGSNNNDGTVGPKTVAVPPEIQKSGTGAAKHPRSAMQPRPGKTSLQQDVARAPARNRRAGTHAPGAVRTNGHTGGERNGNDEPRPVNSEANQDLPKLSKSQVRRARRKAAKQRQNAAKLVNVASETGPVETGTASLPVAK